MVSQLYRTLILSKPQIEVDQLTKRVKRRNVTLKKLSTPRKIKIIPIEVAQPVPEELRSKRSHYHHRNHHHLSLSSLQPPPPVTIIITTITICHYHHRNHHHLSLSSSQPTPSVTIIITTTNISIWWLLKSTRKAVICHGKLCMIRMRRIFNSKVIWERRQNLDIKFCTQETASKVYQQRSLFTGLGLWKWTSITDYWIIHIYFYVIHFICHWLCQTILKKFKYFVVVVTTISCALYLRLKFKSRPGIKGVTEPRCILVRAIPFPSLTSAYYFQPKNAEYRVVEI